MPHNIEVYGSSSCIPCRNVKRYLDANGVKYDYFDVTQDEVALEKITELGYGSIPVIIIDDTEHWQGFNVGKLEKYI